MDLGIKTARSAIAWLCYGTAAVGTLCALIFLLLLR